MKRKTCVLCVACALGLLAPSEGEARLISAMTRTPGWLREAAKPRKPVRAAACFSRSVWGAARLAAAISFRLAARMLTRKFMVSEGRAAGRAIVLKKR